MKIFYSYIQVTIFVSRNPMLCCPDKIIQAILNSNQNKHGGKLREDESFDFELEEDTI